ncbi:hypothetical protein EDC04DRAFT_2765877 [Pisolithus marmoratus]|nr:hypothetical protein EDC04DRAFT_2765877 [Pisolithus marmoratus]
MCFGSSFNTGCSCTWLCAIVPLLETCWSSAVTRLAACLRRDIGAQPKRTFATSRLGRAFLLYVQPWCDLKTPHLDVRHRVLLSRLHIKSLICDGKTRTGCLAMIRSKMGMYLEGGCSSTGIPGYLPFKGNNHQRSASRCRHPGETIEDPSIDRVGLGNLPTSQQALS